MKTKKGITLSMLAIVVLMLAVLSATIVTTVSKSIRNANLSVWTQEITYIQDIMNSSNDKEEMLLNQITFNVSGIDSQIIAEQFNNEIITNNEITLYEINLIKLNIVNSVHGKYKSEKDVYVYSKETGTVYYLKGISGANGEIYYTLTDALKNKYDNAEQISTAKTVVFTPSSVKYTNQPITVKVSLPKTYTDIQVTTSNQNVVVGSQQEEGEKYTYQVNTTNYAGNYEIKVTYSEEELAKSAEYNVNLYDAEKPIIANIEYDNIVYRSTNVISPDYIKNLKATDNKAIKIFKYEKGIIPAANAKEYFAINGTDVAYGRINLSAGCSEYTMYAEDVAGNYTTMYIDLKDIMPATWRDSISEIVDGVPIPKGFVISPYENENTRNNGLVIYALTTDEITAGLKDIRTKDVDKQTSMENRNQFVWVPVDSKKFETLFRRKDLISKESKVTYVLGEIDKYWELVLEPNNMPSDSSKNTTSYISPKTLEEATEMYASVKKYGGFYIGRYEIGAEGTSNHGTYGYIANRASKLSVTMGKYPLNLISWGTSMTDENKTYGAVTLSRSFYPKGATTHGVVSTLVYGVQWDRTMDWIKERIPTINLSNSIDYGVYCNTTISASDLNKNAQYCVWENNRFTSWRAGTGRSSTAGMWLFTTGAYEKAKTCNIYDLAGSLFEWTMEGISYDGHLLRGGAFSYYAYHGNIISRGKNVPYNETYDFGGRVALYIK